ncbi:M14 family metallopeptidase [Flavivirga sp. 57AJ16]|uniref:M14 family metallopeptidase n=1 Tax=Flavivirga sp. 57AJ16 TaxID=3025307 RepID=UPI0023650D4A|nr:M14 family metallopeptidase [Flavivirga sp. 57AJ16]MDD7886513.1 M14 family metallopeptidase [Flavivirga sp. 57AJ16]
MRLILILLFFCISCTNSNRKPTYDFETHFEKSKGLETATYQQTIEFYTHLAQVYSEIAIQTIGETDSGQPLHIVTLNPHKVFDFSKVRENKKNILLINNGIHPGESDGIDATMMLFRDIVQGRIETPKETVLVTIPIYNIGGSLNRNSTTRTNQNGPKDYGFRGNARNYDLNRDFIKCDTKNAKTFTQIFHLVKPDVFIDNHVSNGADYQYTLTHLFTQHNKLGGELGKYLHNDMMPKLEKKLALKNWDMTPYVNVFNEVPEKGFSQFMDSPRYSTGYTTLFNTLGMMVETHMLKPYKQRVEGTYELMKSMVEIIEEDHVTIQQKRMHSKESLKHVRNYALNWEIDTTKTTTLNFKGFEGALITSEITGTKRLKYDRNKPFIKKINYQNYFKPSIEIKVPNAYVIPQSWHNVIELLKLNQVEMTPLKKDSIMMVESYKIRSYDTRKTPYEGHYQHYDTKITKTQKEVNFIKGDYIIYTHQDAYRYLLETLEPQAPDSFFNWNFFDTVLQQKEGFSPYVWEDKALELLNKSSKLKKAFEHRKKDITAFHNNWYEQLDWIHKQSEYYEDAHMQYPVYRVK